MKVKAKGGVIDNVNWKMKKLFSPQYQYQTVSKSHKK